MKADWLIDWLKLVKWMEIRGFVDVGFIEVIETESMANNLFIPTWSWRVQNPVARWQTHVLARRWTSLPINLQIIRMYFHYWFMMMTVNNDCTHRWHWCARHINTDADTLQSIVNNGSSKITEVEVPSFAGFYGRFEACGFRYDYLSIFTFFFLSLLFKEDVVYKYAMISLHLAIFHVFPF